MGNSNISESWIVKTATRENVPFETLEKIANFTKLVCSSKENQSAEVVFDKALTKANKFLRGADSTALLYSPEQYNQDFINADIDLAYVTDALKGYPEARICLSGPPGCGKTGYAHHFKLWHSHLGTYECAITFTLYKYSSVGFCCLLPN